MWPPPWDQDWLLGTWVCDAQPPAQLDPGVLNAQGSPFQHNWREEGGFGWGGPVLAAGKGGEAWGPQWCPILSTPPGASIEVKGPWNRVEGQGHMLRSAQKLQPTKAHFCFHPPLSQLSPPTLPVGPWEAMPEDGVWVLVSTRDCSPWSPGPQCRMFRSSWPPFYVDEFFWFTLNSTTREASAHKGNLLLYHSPIQ